MLFLGKLLFYIAQIYLSLAMITAVVMILVILYDYSKGRRIK